MVELAYTEDLKSSPVMDEGSNPSAPTICSSCGRRYSCLARHWYTGLHCPRYLDMFI